MNNISQKVILDAFNINNKNIINNKSINNNADIAAISVQPQTLEIDPNYVLTVLVDSITEDNDGNYAIRPKST